MWTRTKIICTMGPAVNRYETICQLIDAGMNVARINFSHGTHEDHVKIIQDLKKAREAKKVPLAIMLDTKGPEIRLGEMRGDAVPVEAKQTILLVKEAVVGDGKKIQVHPEVVIDSIKEGMTILFDDGYIISKAVKTSKEGVLVEIQNAGVIKSHKKVNIPNARINLPAMTIQDEEDIIFGCKHDIDLIAASFIRSAEHVMEIKKLLVKQGKSEILVIAKIENSLGVQNFDAILQAADGIMVARGDLGVELPLPDVPHLQKMMIRKCVQLSKPVVTATQMLESMIKNPRPTRAEVSDVANAIYDSTSAIMLSGETAVGQYPIETVKMMKSIVEQAEKDFQYRTFFEREARTDYIDVSSSVALAAVKTAYSADAKAIFAFTSSGFTARLISRFRPEMPIVALSANIKTYHQLAFNWGLIPVDPEKSNNVQEAFATASCFALKRKIVHYGDLVVLTAGSPFGISGTTNMMIVDSIGDVVVRGKKGSGKRIHGKVLLIHSAHEHKPEEVKDRIAVLSYCDPSYLSLLKYALGIVLQNHPEDSGSEREAFQIAKTLNIPIVVRGDGAMSLLHDGQLVTIDPDKRIIFKGSVSEDDEQNPKMCSRN
jgi:pyruvate kinase